MAKKKKLKCRVLNKEEAAELARLIIHETENTDWHNAERKKRVPAPSEGIFIF
jgi:hypothetical protein